MKWSWVVALALAPGCTDASGESGGPDSTHLTDSEDTAPPGDSVDTAAPALVCPADMVPLGPADDDPALCIDPYEATVTGDLGDPDQHTGSGDPTTATAASLVGVVPTTLVSFGQAAATCANTPVVDGRPELGQRRLPSAQEWEDAGDGLWGDGGSIWPYGDTWDDEACATPTADGAVTLTETQATGSYPACVSGFGVYDSTGNAWEWTDSGIVMDIADWFDTADATGVDVSQGPGDTLVAAPGAEDALLLRMQGLHQRTPERDADGTLFLPPEGFDDNALGIAFTGYLVLQADGQDLATLPVFFDVPIRETSQEGPATTSDEPVLILWDADGATVPDKRGCAWYTGSEEGCRLDAGSLDHLHDFLGTISFRCVADPYAGTR